MAAVAVNPGSALWTRDKHLSSACSDVGVRLFGYSTTMDVAGFTELCDRLASSPV